MILVDTGFWLALANRRDAAHARARAALERYREPLITTWPVVTETCHLLVSRLGADAARAFIESGAQGAYDLFVLEPTHLGRITTLMDKYRGLPMDLADASLLILAEEIGTGRIFSTDERDFHAYRWKRRKPFRNLLNPG